MSETKDWRDSCRYSHLGYNEQPCWTCRSKTEEPTHWAKDSESATLRKRVEELEEENDDLEKSFQHMVDANRKVVKRNAKLMKALERLLICPIFNGRVFEQDKETHRAWTLARAELEEAKDGGSTDCSDS